MHNGSWRALSSILNATWIKRVKALKLAIAKVALTIGFKEGLFRYTLGMYKLRTLVELLELMNNYVNVSKYNEVHIPAKRLIRVISWKDHYLPTIMKLVEDKEDGDYTHNTII